MIFEIDDIIPFSKRHKNETIREIVASDSGYIRTLIEKNEDFALSQKAFEEVQEITKGHKDTWKPKHTGNIFDELKPYAVPYLFDFNNEELQKLNQEKLLTINNK